MWRTRKERGSVEGEQDTCCHAPCHALPRYRDHWHPTPQQLYCRAVRVVVERVHKQVRLVCCSESSPANQQARNTKTRTNKARRQRPIRKRKAKKVGMKRGDQARTARKSKANTTQKQAGNPYMPAPRGAAAQARQDTWRFATRWSSLGSISVTMSREESMS